MLMSKGMVFTLWLTSLQWIRYQGVNANFSTPSPDSATTSTSVPTRASETMLPVNPTSLRILSSNATKNPVTESNTESNNRISTTSQGILLSQTTQRLAFTTKGEHYFSTNSNTASLPTGMTTASSDLPTTISAKSSATASMNFNTATDNINVTSMVSPSKTQRNDTTTNISNHLANASTTSMTSVTRGTTVQTSLHLKFTDGSAEVGEHQKENHSRGAVVFGAVVGALLASALIGLVGYFMCTKRKPESFGHQRLYDDTTNDPVLRLDNIPEPLDTSLGDLSYYNPTTATERAAKNSQEAPYDSIPMDQMTSSRLAS